MFSVGTIIPVEYNFIVYLAVLILFIAGMYCSVSIDPDSKWNKCKICIFYGREGNFIIWSYPFFILQRFLMNFEWGVIDEKIHNSHNA